MTFFAGQSLQAWLSTIGLLNVQETLMDCNGIHEELTNSGPIDCITKASNI